MESSSRRLQGVVQLRKLLNGVKQTGEQQYKCHDSSEGHRAIVHQQTADTNNDGMGIIKLGANLTSLGSQQNGLRA